MTLNDKVVWITGASSGIGEGLVYELAKQGCRIIVSARRETELKRVMESCNLEEHKYLVLPIDLENTTDVPKWVNAIMEKFGRIDYLINNGGIGQKSLALETTTEVDRKIMEINYFGNVELTKHVAPIMQKQKSGTIMITTSIIGKFGLPMLSTYAASKHALYGYYDCLRMELKKDNVKVKIACPGFINTNVTFNSLDGNGNKFNENSPAQEKGMSTTVFASKFIGFMKSNRNHKYIGSKELLSVPFKLILPNIYYSIMGKIIK